jgi:hypothetical protein
MTQNQCLGVSLVATLGSGQTDGSVNQADMREPLWKIAQQLTGPGIGFFGEQTEIVRAGA